MSVSAMDVARPGRRLARRRRTRVLTAAAALAGLTLALALARARPAGAPPTVARAALTIDTVRRGVLVRQVRGYGALVPVDIRWVTAASAGRVERIPLLPGVAVTADTVLFELANPELEQAVVELTSAARAARAVRERLKLDVESERLVQESAVARLRGEVTVARFEADGDAALRAQGYAAEVVARRSRAKLDDLTTRQALEEQRLAILARSVRARVLVQDAEIARLDAQLRLRVADRAALVVRAGIDGVLQRLGDEQPPRVGQHVAVGAPLARVADPARLQAEIKIAETQARDLALGQPALVDTRNGVVRGHVARVDPAVQAGTVTVDVAFDEPLPAGARPDLSVDATITLQRLDDVLSVGRPAGVPAPGESRLYRLSLDGRSAARVSVRFGRASVDRVEIAAGLQAGDQLILSDMAPWDAHDQLRLD